MAASPTMVTAVLILPDQAAAMTRCCSTAISRRPDTANSRNRTMATAQPGIALFHEEAHGGQHQHLVGQGIHELAEVGDLVIVPGDIAVQHIAETGQDKDRKRPDRCPR